MTSAAQEQALAFECLGETLIGVLHLPACVASHSRAALGVVVIVGGPQYRAGSHRQFVQLAHALAAAGHPVLRFDVRGMGDSTGPRRTFEDIAPDIRAAIGAMQPHAPEVRHVVLWGLCDGASASLLYLAEKADVRVAGVCLLNPWVRSQESLARTHVKHYYVRRLGQRDFWVKLLRGRVSKRALHGLFGSLRRVWLPAARSHGVEAHSYQARMASGLLSFNGSVLLVLSGDDYTAKEFLEYTAKDPAWQRLMEHETVVRHDLVGADHTFSSSDATERVNKLTASWLADLAERLQTEGTHLLLPKPRSIT